MIPELQRTIDELNAGVAGVCKTLIGHTVVSDDSRQQIKRSLMEMLEPYMDEDLEHIRFIQDPTDGASMIPGNLYTALRLYLGANAPTYAECKGGEYRYQDLSFRWNPEIMKTVCVLPLPLECIKVHLKVARDKKDDE